MQVTGGWRPLLTDDDAERARAVALEVASRLVDQERVDQALAQAGPALERAGLPTADWSMPGLSGANSSVALVCAQLDRLYPDAGWDRLGHICLTAAAEAAGRDGMPLGLYEGVAGLGYSAERLAGGRARYGMLLTSVDEVLTGFVGASRARLEQARGLPVRAWDLISGITGIGVYLLARRTVPAARAALEQVLAALVDLSREAGGAPRWATPAEQLFEDMRESAPEGNVNCGVAHGAPGPLALMALALLNGVEVGGQIDAMRRVAAWLAARALPGRWGPEWPAAVPLGAASTAGPPPAARPGWCYGNAGVARALWLTGRALEETEHVRLAVRALRQALERQQAELPLDSPTLCHGVAGLAQVALRIAADSGDDDLSRQAGGLCLGLVERFDADAPLGYRDVAGASGGARLDVDNPTLLSGASGTALVLLAAATDREPGWDRAMLLS
jgi:lantibiotic biosynthesis protein